MDIIIRFVLVLFLQLLIPQAALEINGENSSDNVLRFNSMDFQDAGNISRNRIQIHNQHGHGHMDPSVLVFFNLEDLHIGKTMVVHFPDRHFSSSNFLPKETADKIPFSSKQLQTLLNSFNFPKGSPQATAMEDTLKECEANPIKGEIKLCATSISSMLDFAKDIFEITNVNQIQVLSTIYLTNLTAELQKYIVTEVPEDISATKMVACHTMPYPYGILYCHYQETENKVYRVKLVSENNGEEDQIISAIAVCHMDTSQWGRSHISFQVLRIEPGTQPVCHFFPADHFVLLPPSTAASI